MVNSDEKNYKLVMGKFHYYGIFVYMREGVKKNGYFTVRLTVSIYDKVSANTASSVPKTSKFQSGLRVVKTVLNT